MSKLLKIIIISSIIDLVTSAPVTQNNNELCAPREYEGNNVWEQIEQSFFIYMTYFWIISLVASNLMLAFKIGIAIDFTSRVKRYGKQSKDFCVESYQKVRSLALKEIEETPEHLRIKSKDVGTQTEDFGGVSIRFTMQDMFDIAFRNAGYGLKLRDDDEENEKDKDF